MYTALSAALVGAVPMTLFFFGFRLARRIFKRTLRFAIKPLNIITSLQKTY